MAARPNLHWLIKPKQQEVDPRPRAARDREQQTYSEAKRQLVVLVLFVLVLVPLSVNAGLFSALVNTDKVLPEEESEIVYEVGSNAQTMPLLKAAFNPDPNPAKGGGDLIVEDGALVPTGAVEEDESALSRTANGEISIYKVDADDTLSQIAEMFDVSAKTIMWANDISDPDLIQPGVELTILPITGVRHVVKDGDTIGSIAKKYGAADSDEAEEMIKDILNYNQLASADEVGVGDTIVVPGGAMASAPTRTTTAAVVSGGSVVTRGGGSTNYRDPLPSGICSQGIHGYNGVDMADSYGAPVYAAAAGTVIVAKASGWNGGYGKYVVVKHPDSTQTLYAHLSSVSTGIGASVSGGQKLGGVGSTGRSTGNHLHFEVRGARNPFCR